MQGPWKASSRLFERGAANESGQRWTEEARMQGYPLEGCSSLLCGSAVARDSPTDHNETAVDGPLLLTAHARPEAAHPCKLQWRRAPEAFIPNQVLQTRATNQPANSPNQLPTINLDNEPISGVASQPTYKTTNQPTDKVWPFKPSGGGGRRQRAKRFR